MGSGTKRKKKDQPLIKRPQNTSDVTGNTGGKRADKQEPSTSNMCPITFETKVSQEGVVKESIRVELVPHGELFDIYILGNNVGSLNKKHSDTINRCSQIGIKYSGEVIKKNEVYYARFTRVA